MYNPHQQQQHPTPPPPNPHHFYGPPPAPAPPPPAPNLSPGYDPVGANGPFAPDDHSTSHLRKPFPLIGEGQAGFTEDLVPYANIRADDMRLCHRAYLCGDRIGKLAIRMGKGHQMLPLLLWQSPDGSLYLMDGWHRRAADERRGVDRAPCLIVGGDAATAICRALMRNKPRNGGFRDDPNSLRALTILATALGGPVSESEANVLGLKFQPHEPLSPQALSLLSPIGIVGEIPTIPKSEGATMPKRPNRAIRDRGLASK